MKSLIKVVVVAAVISVPVAVFAQNNAPLTREQVRAEVAELAKVGYNPIGADPYYPADIQAAEARVAQQRAIAQAQRVDSSGAGNDAHEVAVAGRAATVSGAHVQ